ncbi:MAG: hypothetical protein [Bacteriophage sp.]|nr:MAG: hypothetical protein [Bacteriophage sp.]
MSNSKKKLYINVRDLSKAIGREKKYLYNKDVDNLVENARIIKDYPDVQIFDDEDNDRHVYISENYLSYLMAPTVDLPELKKFVEKLNPDLLKSLKNEVVSLDDLLEMFDTGAGNTDEEKSDSAKEAAEIFETNITDEDEEDSDEIMEAPPSNLPEDRGEEEQELSMDEMDDQIRKAAEALEEVSKPAKSPNKVLSTPDVPKATVANETNEKKVISTELEHPFKPETIGEIKKLPKAKLPPTSGKIFHKVDPDETTEELPKEKVVEAEVINLEDKRGNNDDVIVSPFKQAEDAMRNQAVESISTGLEAIKKADVTLLGNRRYAEWFSDILSDITYMVSRYFSK